MNEQEYIDSLRAAGFPFGVVKPESEEPEAPEDSTSEAEERGYHERFSHDC